MNLGTAFWLAVNRFPELPAIRTKDGVMSYSQWGRRVFGVAENLAGFGIQPGDRVAICAGTGEMPATVFFAVHSLGATAVMINTRWKSADIVYALMESSARALFYDSAARDEIWQIPDDGSLLRVADTDDCELHPGERSYSSLLTSGTVRWRLPGKQGMTILYTSGTTGRPKGVCRSGESDYLAALSIIMEHRWERFERILSVMPLYHTMGLHTLISQVLLNATAVLPPQLKPAGYFDFLEAGQVSALYLVPTMYHDLVEYAGGNRLRPVKKLAFAGAPMRPQLQDACRNLLQPEIFVNQYGCTEMIVITINHRLDQKPLSAGRPALQSRIRIAGFGEADAGNDTGNLPPGEVGEILVDATLPQAFCGYLGNPVATERVMRNGWYYTGDLGHLDEDGDLFLSGRVDDMIISGGENIYPHEVEAVLAGCPGVQDAAVIGMSDERWGQRVAAFIVPSVSTLTVTNLELFCINHSDLARYKRPKEFFLVDEIPKSPTGKVLRSALRARFSETK